MIKLVYSIHMKRTNLVLDAALLEDAVRVLGVKTYSAAVNLALAEVLRIRKIQSIPQFFGQGLWEGNLAEMREDKVQQVSRRKRQEPRSVRARARSR
jgi:Arc/MetJ family transcription regulator